MHGFGGHTEASAGALAAAPAGRRNALPLQPTRALEKQCLRSRMNAFSCWVLRAVVRHTAWQYSNGVSQWPVSGLQPNVREHGRFERVGSGQLGHTACAAVRTAKRSSQPEQLHDATCGSHVSWPRSLVAAAVHAVHACLGLVVRLEAARHAVLVLRAALVLCLAPAGIARACAIVLNTEKYPSQPAGKDGTTAETASRSTRCLASLLARPSRFARVLLARGATAALVVHILACTNHAAIISDVPSAEEEEWTSERRARWRRRRQGRQHEQAQYCDHLPDAVLLQLWGSCWSSLQQQQGGKRAVSRSQRACYNL